MGTATSCYWEIALSVGGLGSILGQGKSKMLILVLDALPSTSKRKVVIVHLGSENVAFMS